MPSIQFKGKSFVQNHHLAVPYHQLVPQKDKSPTDNVSLHDNLVIQGDNLLSLKALLPTYAGKIKCIYIDPPYNTGNEQWKYSDNVNSPLIKEWIGRTVGKEGEDFTRHDKWLCMMMPRLKILRDLLSLDGVIFISIDDNEQHHLRQLMDEIFGPNNFVANIIWQKKYSPQNDAKYYSTSHEHLVQYAKKIEDWTIAQLPRTEAADSRYKNPDNDPRGPWKSSDLTRQEFRERDYYQIVSPETGKSFNPPKGNSWGRPKETVNELIADNRIWFGPDGNSIPSLKRFLSEVKDGITPQTIWLRGEVGDTQEGKKQIKEIFGDVSTFETAKPTRLIKHLIKIANIGNNDDSLILDSFAGSGTTGQAVLELNKEDGGSRKFVLVEMEDYANDITAERIRRVIKGVPSANNVLVRAGLGGTFSYFGLGDPIETESILNGNKLPSYLELARYVYYTATGEEFDESKMDETKNFVGTSSHYDVFMLYKPDIEYLKQTALTLNLARELREKAGSRQLLVFAPTKYVESGELDDLMIDFCQLPFEIYKIGK